MPVMVVPMIMTMPVVRMVMVRVVMVVVVAMAVRHALFSLRNVNICAHCVRKMNESRKGAKDFREAGGCLPV
jgi:ABC-type transport system involved in Fe-S cluster assembly fused permease/ATPase subunit